MRWLVVCALAFATPLAAQDSETLADIRQELSVLYVEVQKLKRELSTTGGVNANLAGAGVLDRVDAMERELQRLTSATEQLSNRVESIVSDGTNRIGDLEFRLCELEAGCDIATLGETPLLGGVRPQPRPVAQAPSPLAGIETGGVELAVAERDDFERAKVAFDNGDFAAAADAFQRFTDTYQGGPLTGIAHLLRGEALESMGQTASAARAFLTSYSGTPNGPTSPTALLRLGLALNTLGQTSEACITLGEVTLRFPQSDASLEAQTARANMGCA